MVLADHCRKLCQLLLLPPDNCLLPSGREQNLQHTPSMRQSSLACLCIFAFEDALHKFRARATSQMSWDQVCSILTAAVVAPAATDIFACPLPRVGVKGKCYAFFSVQQGSRQGFACFSCTTSESVYMSCKHERLCQMVLEPV